MLTPSRTLLALALLLVLVVLATHLLRPRTTPLVFYASAQGTGSACTQAAPCLPGSWWPLARPGATLLLMDGVYTAALGMLAPPAGLAGTPTAPITLKALHDGQVLLHAEIEDSAQGTHFSYFNGPASLGVHVDQLLPYQDSYQFVAIVGPIIYRLPYGLCRHDEEPQHSQILQFGFCSELQADALVSGEVDDIFGDAEVLGYIDQK